MNRKSFVAQCAGETAPFHSNEGSRARRAQGAARHDVLGGAEGGGGGSAPLMTAALDVYRSANVLIREHGDDAALEAAQRADAMLEKGDMEGAAV